MKTLFILFWLVFTAWAENGVDESSVFFDPTAPDTTTESTQESVEAPTITGALTLSNVTLPDHPYIGEIIPITVKLTPNDLASGDISYILQNERGVKIFSQTPYRSLKDDGVYDTFYLLVQSASIRLPDITATISASGEISNTIVGTTLIATTLTPPSSYANVLAESFKILTYKTTAYNQANNIVVFTIKASRCNINDFFIPGVENQGFESKLPNVKDSQMTYYAIIPNTQTELVFSFFNLQSNRYESLSIPILVDDDLVSTQTDLAPTDERHTELKITLGLISLISLGGLYYWKRRKTYLYSAIVPLLYVIYLLIPDQEVCIKTNSPVYLLPMHHGTVFERTAQEEHLKAENEVGDFVKIRFANNTVGWVNKRDLCSN